MYRWLPVTVKTPGHWQRTPRHKATPEGSAVYPIRKSDPAAHLPPAGWPPFHPPFLPCRLPPWPKAPDCAAAQDPRNLEPQRNPPAAPCPPLPGYFPPECGFPLNIPPPPHRPAGLVSRPRIPPGRFHPSGRGLRALSVQRAFSIVPSVLILLFFPCKMLAAQRNENQLGLPKVNEIICLQGHRGKYFLII